MRTAPINLTLDYMHLGGFSFEVPADYCRLWTHRLWTRHQKRQKATHRVAFDVDVDVDVDVLHGPHMHRTSRKQFGRVWCPLSTFRQLLLSGSKICMKMLSRMSLIESFPIFVANFH